MNEVIANEEIGLRDEQIDRLRARVAELEADAKMRDLVERYLAYHNGVAQCESGGDREKCLCGVCVDARAAMERK